LASRSGSLASRWSELRYERLLPLAARSRAWGRRYATLVGGVELARDGRRRRAAIARIARWLDVSRAAARRIFRASLVSEAREEADTAFFMRDRDALLRWLPDRVEAPAGERPMVYLTMHFGSPVLAWVFLRERCSLDVRIIIRELDAANPMAGAKRRWGERKLVWLRELSGVDHLMTDGASVARAREHLLATGPLFAAIDVPGEVVARSSVVSMAGDRVSFSSGMLSLARMTGCTFQPVVAISRPERMAVHFGRAIEPVAGADPTAAVFAELEGFIRRFPGEWWLWPYVGPA
jgi:hypothetical protein